MTAPVLVYLFFAACMFFAVRDAHQPYGWEYLGCLFVAALWPFFLVESIFLNIIRPR